MMKFLIVLLTGFAIYILFRLTRLILAKPGNHRWRNAAIALVPVEMLVWTGYFFRSLEYLFSASSYYNYLLTAVLLIGFGFLVWFYLKEVVAGAFFKLQHSPKTGRHLQLGGLEGVIRRINATHISVDTPDGVVVKVPYSKLAGKVFSLSAHKEHARDFKFTVRLDKRWDKDETISRIRTALLLSPFCSYKEPVDVRIADEGRSDYTCDISVRPLSQRFDSRIEKALRDGLVYRGDGNGTQSIQEIPHGGNR